MPENTAREKVTAQKFDGDKIIERLNLSPQQKQRIQAIRQNYQNRLEQSKQSLRQIRQELGQMMSGDASENVIRQKFQQLQQRQQEVNQLRFDSMLEMREVLEPSQRQELAEILRGRRRRRPQR